MGLWASHGCWSSGAYSAFSRWRHEVARAGGYKIIETTAEDQAQGFYGHKVDLDWDAFEDKNYQGEWDSPPGDDPLLFLIVHSDCDGVIHPQHGVHIARRLEQILPLLDESHAGGHIRSMRGRTEEFIAGLRKAAAAGEDVEFG